MITPFRMKDTVGKSYTTNLDDTYNLKRALAGLGHIDTTQGTLDRYPDGSMLKGIEAFQREQGLKVDGIVRPDGPTHQRLNAILGGIGRSAGRPSTNVTPQSDRISTSCFPGDQVEQPQVKLDEPVTSSGNVVLSDAQKVKSALEFLGVTRTGAQSDPYPSHDLFRGIKDFQKREGLRVDGEMRPGGETEQRMNALIQEADGLGVPTQHSDSQNGVQVAAAPVNKSMGRRYGPEGALILDQYTGGGAAGLSAAAAAAILLNSKRKKAGFSEEVPGMSDRQSNSFRTDVAPPLPPLPGYEPPDKGDRKPKKTEFPIASSEIPIIKGRPVNEVMRQDPYVFQEISDEFKQVLSDHLKSHRGDAYTQKGNNIIVGEVLDEVLSEYGPEMKENIKHIHGGYENGVGKKLEEEYVANKETKRLDSSHPDFTLQDQRTLNGGSRGKRLRGITSNTLKDGITPVAHERRQLLKLRNNSEVGDMAAAFPKLRPGMDEKNYRENVKAILKEYISSWIGSPVK